MYKFVKVNIELFQDKINLIMNNNSIPMRLPAILIVEKIRMHKLNVEANFASNAVIFIQPYKLCKYNKEGICR